jgi:hypothetical protein
MLDGFVRSAIVIQKPCDVRLPDCRRRARWLRLLVSCCILSTTGCGKKTPDYTPSPEAAQAAVRQGLEAWKSGEPVGDVPNTTPKIFVTDVGRKPGQLLQSFRILGETRGTTGRTIAVQLQLTNPIEEIKARYIVVGIDPLWVFRQEDYEKLMHWDHHMDAEPTRETPADATKPVNQTAIHGNRPLIAAVN